jgi:urea-proton symporter
MYYTSDVVGSPGKFYDLLLEASNNMPIAGNRNGSYLTMKSNDGLVFAIDLLIAGFSTVWLDQAYWQRAIASQPETSVKAYLFGGIAWYGVPFGFATCLGLGCVALTSSPSFPTYPDSLTETQVGAGLSSPAAAIALLGSGGAGLMLLLLFMAVTSSTSAELIAVSSLVTFDIYKTYIKPKATSSELVRVSHYGIIGYGLVLGAFCCGLNAGNANLTWILTVLGVIVGGASLPVGLVLLWEKMSTTATLFSPWIGFIGGLVAWFIVTWKRSGNISVLTTGDVTNAVAGNVTSWGLGGVMSVLLSFLFPGKLESTDPEAVARNNKINGEVISNEQNVSSVPTPEKSGEPFSSAAPDTIVPTGNDIVDFLETKLIQPLDPAVYHRANRIAIWFNVLFFVVAIILVPFTLFGTEWIFTKAGFTGWIVVSFIWVWVSMVICVIWPAVESRSSIWRIVKGISRDIATRGKGAPAAGDHESFDA